MANKTTLAQLELNFGMLYVVQLADGRLVIVDGGVKSDLHRKSLLDYLETKKIDGKVQVAAWLFTHLDGDHVDNAFDVLATYPEMFEVECFGISIPNIEDFEPREGDKPDILRWRDIAIKTQTSRLEAFEKAKAAHPTAEVWAPKCDEHRRFGDLDIHVLITGEERIPEDIYSHNQRSLVMKFTFDSGKTCMITGDSGGSARAEFLLKKYPEELLKSDILQVIHHGMYGGHLELYQAIDPDICFWPTTEARFFGYEQDRDGNPVSHFRLTQDLPCNAWLRDNSVRVRTHYHGEQSLEIDMGDFSTTLLK